MPTQITYINNSMNKNLPQIFVFSGNEISSFDAITDGIAWRVIKNIGRNSLSKFIYQSEYSVRASWLNGENYTNELPAERGMQYSVVKNKTGIILEKSGLASDKETIEIINKVNVKGGILAQLCNDGKVSIGKKIVAFDQIAIFKPSTNLYWGLASEVIEGRGIKSATLNSRHFFELSTKESSEIVVSLNGNAKSGYFFEVEEQS